MEIKYHILYSIENLYKMYQIIKDEGFDINDFECPESDYTTSDIRKNGDYTLVPFRYKKYYFFFSDRILFNKIQIQFNSDDRTTNQIIYVRNFNEQLDFFIKWVKQIKINEEFESKVDVLFKRNNTRKIDDKSIIEHLGKSRSNELPILYKYKSNIAHLEQILENKCLWLTFPRDFDDELDCRITFKNIDIALEFCKENFHEETNIVIEILLSKTENVDEKFEILMVFINQVLITSVGVFCLTTEKDHPYFWENYAFTIKEDKKVPYSGYSIEFDFNLCETIIQNRIFKVDYDGEELMEHSGGKIDLPRIYQTKIKKFDHEGEYRIIVLKNKHNNTSHIDLNINPECIKSITFGHKFQGSTDEIKKLAIENGFDIDFYKKDLKNAKYITIKI